jgi:hypothetical protein
MNSGYLSAIHTEEGFKVVIDKTKINYIRPSTVKKIIAKAILSNDSSYRN